MLHPYTPEALRRNSDQSAVQTFGLKVDRLKHSAKAVSRKKRTRAKTFRNWFKRHVDTEGCQVIREHGVIAGIPGLNCYRDTVALYERFEGEIWDLALGRDRKLDELISREDIGTATQFANFMVWAAATRLAYE